MTTTVANGMHWSCDAQTISIFGLRGVHFAGQWAIDEFSDDALLKFTPCLPVPQISSIIEGNKRIGVFDQIGQLQVDRETVVILYFKGLIKPDNLVNAQDGIDHIDIPDVDLGIEDIAC